MSNLKIIYYNLLFKLKKKKNIFKLNINTFTEIQIKGHLAVVIFNKVQTIYFWTWQPTDGNTHFAGCQLVSQLH